MFFWLKLLASFERCKFLSSTILFISTYRDTLPKENCIFSFILISLYDNFQLLPKLAIFFYRLKWVIIFYRPNVLTKLTVSQISGQILIYCQFIAKNIVWGNQARCFRVSWICCCVSKLLYFAELTILQW